MKIFYLLIVYVVYVSSAGLNVEFSWSRIDYQWSKNQKYNSGSVEQDPSRIVFDGQTNAQDIINRDHQEIIDYQYENNIPMGANVWQDKLFISIARRRPGIPSTLNYIPLRTNKHKKNVPLKPYPNWKINNIYSKENFVSVYRTAIDACDRMWFVDTGILEYPGNRTKIKQHQIVIINLNTDKVIHRYNLPDNVIESATVLANLNIDASKKNCEDAFAYIPDLSGWGLIVYSLKQNKAWRVNHWYFLPDPQAKNFLIAGYSFQFNDGIFSVQLSKEKPDGYRDMFFHAMAGTRIYKVSTKVLRNEALATRRVHDEGDFVEIGDKGPNFQTSTADIHKPTGILFMALVNQNSVGCWNINKGIETLSIIQRDDDQLIYPSDVRISGDRLYVLTNTMPRFLNGQLNYNDINFRVWSGDVKSAIRGTNCEI
ncbi:unnamed protein product [Ceutorhynchus assimilis]|uniref:Bee-milk protein n=1 Tax=Ceutorhynchus assimilis TaxID=467358 RepID=A0A9N9QNP9_9CUCU|nr:unnamed protein product [Ceutorhynchus assimilis]